MQYDGPDPSACWNIIYEKIRQMHSSISDNSQAEAASESFFKSGADMFGFSDPHVLRLIQVTHLEFSCNIIQVLNTCYPHPTMAL